MPFWTLIRNFNTGSVGDSYIVGDIINVSEIFPYVGDIFIRYQHDKIHKCDGDNLWAFVIITFGLKHSN